MAQHYPMVIGADLPAYGKADLLIAPATGMPFATVAVGTAKHVETAVDAASAAFPAWSALSVGERASIILQIAAALQARLEEFAQLESVNAGKPLKLTRFGDIPFCIDNLKYFAGAARHQEGASAGEYVQGYTSMLRREPLGVVGLITPWNYPLMMAIWKIAPAIAAGNTVVLKPAPNTPATTILFAQLALQAGLPPGVVNIVPGGADVGEALCTHPAIRMISFTGSTATGIRISQLAGPLLKRVTLELGGKAPFVVFADADLEAAARGAVVASFVNGGQDCTAATRIYVQDSIRDAFLARFKALAETLVVGDPMVNGTDMGPLTSAEHRARVHAHVQAARSAGIAVVLGGTLPQTPGFYYPATILADAPESAPCVVEEIFGPVVVVNRFSDEDDGIAKANAVKYGLAGSVWTSNVQRAFRLSRALQCGTVWINDHLPLASEMPHGGYKYSGIGKDLSHYVLEEFSQVKHVMVDTTGLAVKPWHGVAFGKL